MSSATRTLAELIYSEFIEYTIDYIEDEIDFESTLVNLERIRTKLYNYKYDVEGQLLITEFETMESILALFLVTSIDMHEGNQNDDVLEERLTSKLIKLIENEEENISQDKIGGIKNERRKN